MSLAALVGLLSQLAPLLSAILAIFLDPGRKREAERREAEARIDAGRRDLAASDLDAVSDRLDRAMRRRRGLRSE